jgi:sporulation protein YlmC with PRC-barrel domain
LLRTKTEANHPVKEQIIENQLNDGKDVIEQVILGPANKDVLFFKQMTHHLIDIDWDFMAKTKNILLIRNPRQIISSYSKVIPNPTMEDIGVALQQKLYRYLKEMNALTAVVDARDLLLNPAAMLEKICQLCDIPYLPTMLEWKSGPKEYDGIWAPHWYSEVHQSTGFKPYLEKETNLPEHLEPLADACEPYYAELIANSLKVS